MTAFRLASIKYLCVRFRSRSSFFSKASWDVDKLSKYFIMTSDIIELTSTISGRASASGVRHLREDKLITALWSMSGPSHGWGRSRLNPPLCVHRGVHTQNSWDKMDIKHSLESKTSQKVFGKFGKQREAALFSLQLGYQARATGWAWSHSSDLRTGGYSHLFPCELVIFYNHCQAIGQWDKKGSQECRPWYTKWKVGS